MSKCPFNESECLEYDCGVFNSGYNSCGLAAVPNAIDDIFPADLKNIETSLASIYEALIELCDLFEGRGF